VQLAIRKYAKQAVAEVNRKYTEHLREKRMPVTEGEPELFDL
jgi:hypothetical protein